MKNGYDLLKVMAILLVVIGHTTNHYADGFSSLVTKGIYLFHMTFIYIIRGFGCDAWPLMIAQAVTIIFTLLGSIAAACFVRLIKMQMLIGEK